MASPERGRIWPSNPSGMAMARPVGILVIWPGSRVTVFGVSCLGRQAAMSRPAASLVWY